MDRERSSFGGLGPLLRGHRDLGGPDAAAIETFVNSLAGSGKPLVISGATLVTPGRPATERDELIAAGPIAARITNMRAALAAADWGVRTCLVMLPRSVHGRGERHGFIPQLITAARAKGVCGYIGDGAGRWPAVHVKDAARLYRPAIEQAPAGAVLNAVGDEGVPIREIAEAIGRHLVLPAPHGDAVVERGPLPWLCGMWLDGLACGWCRYGSGVLPGVR